MAFGTPVNRKRKASQVWRCSDCGRERPAVSRPTLDVPEIRSVGAACPDHLDAVVLRWPPTMQGAAIWIEQNLLTRGWAEVEAEIAVITATDKSARARALVPVLTLMQRWGGCLPERALPGRAEARGGNSLYGVQP